MARTTREFPFNCQHCACAILRDGRPAFTCPRCHSRLLVPPAGGATKTFRRRGRTLSITSDNLPNRWGRYPYQTESYHEPLLEEFRDAFPLKGAYRGMDDEFSALVNLRHLVRNVWFPSRPSPAFLKKYGFWIGNRLDRYWFCTHFARMFVMSATALGIPARIVNVARGVKLHESCWGHMVVDVWSNQYQKWVYMDVLFDFHYENAAGEPLDLLEARDQFWRKKASGLHLCTLRDDKGYAPGRYCLAGPAPNELVKSLQERTLNTFWCLFYHGQNYFTCPVEERRVRILRYEDDLTKGKRLVGNGYEHYKDEPMVVRTGDRLDIYPTLNNAEVQLYDMRHDGRDALRVYIATTTPNLKRIRYRLDGGAWRKYGVDGFALPLGTKRTVIEAQTQNCAGRHGRPSVVDVRVRG